MWFMAVVVAVGALFYLSATAGKVPGPITSCPPPGRHVLLIGDSLAEGLGPLLARYASDCETPYSYQARRGSHVTGWNEMNWSGIRPDIVLVSLGGNDYQRTDPDNVRAAIPKLVGDIRAAGGQVLWIHPPRMPYDDRIGVRDMWLDAIGRSSEDWFNTVEIPYPVSGDQIHPTPEGYKMLAAAIWRWTVGRSQA